MSDPIEKLNRLGDALEGAPMPLPASEIRARGDRIRRRRHAVIAGASAAVVAAVAVPVVAFTVGGSDDEPDIAPSPTISDPVPTAPLSRENLLTGEEAIYPTGGLVDWVERDTVRGDGQGAYSACTQTSMDGLGAGPVFQRNFDFVITDTQDVDSTNHLNEIIAEFPSAADAEAAYAEIKSWYDDCLPSPATRFEAGEFAPVPIGVDGTAEAQLSTYGPVEESVDPSGEASYFLETGIVLSGDRIAVLSQSIIGQDYNFEVDRRPVVQMLPAAAERLVLGTGTAPDETPTDVEAGWPTSIPAGFPLTSGWPEDDGSSEYQLDGPSIDNQAMIPAGDLEGCQTIEAGDAVDRLTARLSIGSSTYSREVQLFASPDDAGAFLDSAQDSFSACAAEGPTETVPSFTTEVLATGLGQESWLVTRASDGVGRVVIYLVRVGNAVFIDLASDEGTGDTVDALVSESGTSFADVIRAMYDLQGRGEPERSAPAGVTAIPDDFPLDLAISEPPIEDSETTIEGPAADVVGVRAQTACGATLAMPNAGSQDPAHELGYSVSSLEGYDGRTIRAYPTVQDALDQMSSLRADLQGCERDSEGDGLSDRLWQTFNSDTGYDSITFGYTYEIRNGVGAPAGQLYTVVRVGNAVLAIEWAGEYGAEFMASSASTQVQIARGIAVDMCIFTVDGC